MASLYLGVYKALYDYEARAEEELSIRADDLLYLLEKSDVDQWWKVKKRVLPVGDEEVDEPVGLIPSTYIEKVCQLITDRQFKLDKSRWFRCISCFLKY